MTPNEWINYEMTGDKNGSIEINDYPSALGRMEGRFLSMLIMLKYHYPDAYKGIVERYGLET